jgi:hypothetical protein
MAPEFAAVFERLKTMLGPYEGQLVVVHDTPDHYYLDAPVLGPNKKPLFFGAVSIKKNYVSYYLMPVYIYPDLLNEVSGDLKKRMQGKSCFNFKHVDETLLDELSSLTAQAFERFEREGLVG